MSEILTTFQTGSIIHCGSFSEVFFFLNFSFFCKDLDKNYNDKLCLEYELNHSPVHLTTTDECILAALRKLSSLEQQIAQLIRENQIYLFQYQNRRKDILQQEENFVNQSSEDSHQQLIDVHKKQVNRKKKDFFSIQIFF